RNGIDVRILTRDPARRAGHTDAINSQRFPGKADGGTDRSCTPPDKLNSYIYRVREYYIQLVRLRVEFEGLHFFGEMSGMPHRREGRATRTPPAGFPRSCQTRSIAPTSLPAVEAVLPVMAVFSMTTLPPMTGSSPPPT